jgi:uncharacterized membrane protein YgcG
MKHPSLKMYTAIIVSVLAMSACGSSKGQLNAVEDDVYYSKKQADKQTVYVPEVDVQELIKKNPPQYNKQYQEPTYRNDESNSTANPNAALQYPSYRAARDAAEQQQVEQQNNFLTTTSYVGQEEEAEEAARLRMQYSGDYNNYNTTNNYYNGWNNNGWNNNGWNNGWNNGFAGGPALNIGWNNFNGWGVGLGWNVGWNNGWGGGWPHYNPYWGWNDPWGWNNPWAWGGGWNNWYGPGWGWNGGWGCNNWGWRNNCNNNWGHNGFVERGEGRQQRARQMPGSNLPGATQRIAPNGQQAQQGTTNGAQNRVAMPRSSNEAQLINQNGQPVYIAPEQYRTTTPRSYNTYQKSEQQAEATRQATPRPTYTYPQTPPANSQGSGNNRASTPATGSDRQYRTPRSYQNTPNQQNTTPSNNNQEQQQPVFRRPAPSRSYETQRPSSSGGGGGSYSPPSTGGGGGSRGGSSGGGGGGSTPRPRSR